MSWRALEASCFCGFLCEMTSVLQRSEHRLYKVSYSRDFLCFRSASITQTAFNILAIFDPCLFQVHVFRDPAHTRILTQMSECIQPFQTVLPD